MTDPADPMTTDHEAREAAGVHCLACGHRVKWHHDTEGCDFNGRGPHRCPCRLSSDAVARQQGGPLVVTDHPQIEAVAAMLDAVLPIVEAHDTPPLPLPRWAELDPDIQQAAAAGLAAVVTHLVHLSTVQANRNAARG